MRCAPRLAYLAALALLSVACHDVPDSSPSSESPLAAVGTVKTTTADGVTLYGESYGGALDAVAPLIVLFHQGGSSGRGEYADLIPWLNEAGYRAIAWDLRAGGDRHGAANRTVEALPEGTSAEYCAAYADLEAALAYVTANSVAEKVIVWGSSYSAALVFRLAAEYPGAVSGVLAFSPAAGGPLETCRARQWVDAVEAPALVLRPASEMELASAVEQRDVLTAAGIAFRVVQNGVHGSSMLVDARTGADMSTTRTAIADWLAGVVER